MERDSHGHWLPGCSANSGGRIGVPAVIKIKLRELSPRAVEVASWIALASSQLSHHLGPSSQLRGVTLSVRKIVARRIADAQREGRPR